MNKDSIAIGAPGLDNPSNSDPAGGPTRSAASTFETEFDRNPALDTATIADRIGGEPFYFNPGPQRLFGVYYRPRIDPVAEPAVLVCSPYGNEYVRSYNAIRKLCERLSQTGFPVLKFDYCGMGDSYGNGTDGTVAEWRANIRAAAAELRRRTGRNELTIVGLRLGAALPVGVLLERVALKNLVLWDPVVNGADYLTELETAHRSCLSDTFRFRRSQARRLTQTERLGYRFPQAMQASISELNLLNRPFPYDNCFLVTSEPRPEYEQLAKSLTRNTKGRFTRECVCESTGWGDYRQAETTLRINRMIAAITTKISNGFV